MFKPKFRLKQDDYGIWSIQRKLWWIPIWWPIYASMNEDQIRPIFQVLKYEST